MDKLFILIFIAIIFIIFSKFISISNKLKRYLVIIKESKKNVDIAIVKRYDTISQMIKVAKSFAKHENDTFTNIIKLRNVDSISESNDTLKNQNEAIKQIYAVAESYPELKSCDEFLKLQEEIDEENEKLAAAKRIVNSNISLFNQEIVTFPTSIVANINKMTEMDFLAEDNLSNKKSINDFDYNV